MLLDRKKLVVENKRLKKKVDKNYEMIGESEATSLDQKYY